MTQAQLNRAVADATGESVETIRRRGFSMVHPLKLYDPDADDQLDPQTVDWDFVDYERQRQAA